MNIYEVDFDYDNGCSVGSATRTIRAKSKKDARAKLKKAGYGKVSNFKCKKASDHTV